MMNKTAMANAMISELKDETQHVSAINKFYLAICKYVEANMEVYYNWHGILTSTPFSPDPIKEIKATIKTDMGSFDPFTGNEDGGTTALPILSAALNAKAATWHVVWPPTFEKISPAFIIPTINLTLSGATEQLPALEHICDEIINGIKQATPIIGGNHFSFAQPPIPSFQRIV